jgi:hypothetical protein
MVPGATLYWKVRSQRGACLRIDAEQNVQEVVASPRNRPMGPHGEAGDVSGGRRTSWGTWLKHYE